jgi:MscS family membrane protein
MAKIDGVKHHNDSHIHFNKRMTRRILFLTVLILVPGALLILQKSGYIVLPGKSKDYVTSGIFIILAILSANLVLKFTITRLTSFLQEEMEVEQRIFTIRIYRTSVYLIALAVVFNQLGISIQSIAIYLGFLTTGIAFAVRDVLLSLFIWFIILTKKPFRLNDYVKIDTFQGRVIRIGTFFITLDTFSGDPGKVIKVPNKILLDESAINFGSRDVIYDSVSIRLVRVPHQGEKKLEDLKVRVSSLQKDAHPVYTFLDSSGEFIHLIVSFYAPRESLYEFRTRVIFACNGVFKTSLPGGK